jgi:hypothetical protein
VPADIPFYLRLTHPCSLGVLASKEQILKSRETWLPLKGELGTVPMVAENEVLRSKVDTTGDLSSGRSVMMGGGLRDDACCCEQGASHDEHFQARELAGVSPHNNRNKCQSGATCFKI